jgi:hypothetical protein
MPRLPYRNAPHGVMYNEFTGEEVTIPQKFNKFSELPKNIQTEIYSYENTDCKKIFKNITKEKINSIIWNNVPPIPINVSPEVNLNIDCATCRLIENVNENKQRVNREKCKIYYNKCRLFDLLNKYTHGWRHNRLVDIAMLNNILLATIPNTENRNNVRSEQNYLIRLGANLDTIRDRAFHDQSLKSVSIPDSVSVIGNRAFQYNRLTEVNIPDSVTFIGEDAFAHNKLTEVNIPNYVEVISDRVFAYNRLTSIIIPNSVTTIGLGAFASNMLTSVTIPDSVTAIDDYAFNNNPLETVRLPRQFLRRGNFYRIFGERAEPIEFTFTD